MSAAIAALVAVALALVATPLEHGTLDAAPPPAAVTAPPGPPLPPPAVVVPLAADALADRITPAIVALTARSGLGTTAGTGIVLGGRGPSGADTFVLTNHHVVDGASEVTATGMRDRSTYAVDVVGYDSARDLAVLRLSGGAGLPHATPARGPVRIGDPVTAVGNADGGGVALPASGKVTRVEVRITTRNTVDGSRNDLSGLIEVDADVRPGDSGGPLVNAFGEVVGVNAAGNAAEPGTAAPPAPKSYAIPIDAALALVDEVLSGRPAAATVHIGPTPRLGVTVRDHREPGAQTPSGAEVTHAGFRSPAEGAGLTTGDVIVEFDGVPIRSASDLTLRLNAHRPGDRVDVRWTDAAGLPRGGSLVLQEGPPR